MFFTRQELKKKKLTEKQIKDQKEKDDLIRQIKEDNKILENEIELEQSKIDVLEKEIKDAKDNINEKTYELKTLKELKGKKYELKSKEIKNDIKEIKESLDLKNQEIKTIKDKIKEIKSKKKTENSKISKNVTKISENATDITADDKFDNVIVKLLEENINSDIELKYEVINSDDKIITNIIHMADIHIRLSALHHEYQIVFNKLYDNLLELKKIEPNTLIVICGDLLHSKDELKPDTIVMAWNFLKNLADIFPVIIISGNHDMIQNNNNKIDSITSILKDRPIESIHYLLNSGVYIYNNIAFGVSSLMDNYVLSRDKLDEILDLNNFKKSKNYENFKNFKNFKRIGLYHGQVGNVKIGTGNMVLVDDKVQDENILGLNNFNVNSNYDYILLGDIHKYQYLNKEKTVAYSGSLISQNFSETDDFHGYLHWNIITGVSKYEKILNDNAYHKINIDELIDINNEIVDDKVNEKLNYSGYLRIDINEILVDHINNDKIKKQILSINPKLKISFKILINSYRLDNNDSNSNSDNKEDIDKKYEPNKELKQYINDVYGINDKRIDIIFNEFNKLISESNNEKNIEYETGKWNILWLAFDDMYGYGKNNFIDFTKFSVEENEIVGIFGENSFGKSSLIDIITYMLYYRSARDNNNTAPKDIININSNKSIGVLVFESNRTKYLIKRVTYRKKTINNAISCDLHFYKLIKIEENEHVNNSDVFMLLNKRYKKISLTCEKVKTEAAIVKIVGTYENFIYTSVLLQSNNKTFKSKSPVEKKEILCTLLNINHFSNIESEVHKKYNQFKDRYNFLINDTNKISDKSLDELKNESKHIEDITLVNLNNTIMLHKGEIILLYEKIRQLTLTMHHINSTISNDKELEKNKRKLDEYNSSIDINNQKLDKLKNQLSKIEKNISKLSLLGKQDEIVKEYNQLIEYRSKKQKKLSDKIKMLTNSKLSLKLTELDDTDNNLDNHIALLEENQEKLNNYNSDSDINKLLLSVEEIDQKISKLTLLKKSDKIIKENEEYVKQIKDSIFSINNKISDLFVKNTNIKLYSIDDDYSNYDNNQLLLQNIENDMLNNYEILELKDTIIDNYNNLISSNTTILDDTFVQLKKNIKEKKIDITETNNLIENLIDTVNLLLNRGKEHNFITKHKELNKLEIEYNQKNEQKKIILKNSKLIKKNNKLLTSINNIDKEINQYRLELDELNSRSNVSQKYLLLLEQEKNEVNYNREKLLITMKIDESNKYRSDLETKIKENKRNIKIIKKNNETIGLISSIDSEITELEIKLDELKKSNDITEKYEELLKQQKLELYYKTDINNINSEKNTIDIDNSKILNNINTITKNIDDYYKDKDSIVNNSKIDEEINKIKQDIDRINKLIDDINSEIVLYNNQNSKLLKDIEHISNNKLLLLELNVNIEIYKVLYEITGKNGFQTYLLSKSLDSINSRINNILEPFINKTITLSLQDDKKYININMDIKTEIGNIDTLSGMETFMIDLVFKIILSNITHLPSSSILFIDEGISVLDKNRLAAIDELFAFLKIHYNTIFLITHIKNVKDFINHSIEITKKNDRSTIVSHYNNKFYTVLADIDDKDDISENNDDIINQELNNIVAAKSKKTKQTKQTNINSTR